jgi:hypothetical protein
MDLEQSSIQTLAEALRQFDRLFVAQQLHYIPQAVVHGGTVTAIPEVVFNPYSQLRREIAIQLVRQLPANLVAIEFYNAWLERHNQHRSIGCRRTVEVTLSHHPLFSDAGETFTTVPNPTAT